MSKPTRESVQSLVISHLTPQELEPLALKVIALNATCNTAQAALTLAQTHVLIRNRKPAPADKKALADAQRLCTRAEKEYDRAAEQLGVKLESMCRKPKPATGGWQAWGTGWYDAPQKNWFAIYEFCRADGHYRCRLPGFHGDEIVLTALTGWDSVSYDAAIAQWIANLDAERAMLKHLQPTAAPEPSTHATVFPERYHGQALSFSESSRTARLGGVDIALTAVEFRTLQAAFEASDLHWGLLALRVGPGAPRLSTT